MNRAFGFILAAGVASASISPAMGQGQPQPPFQPFTVTYTLSPRAAALVTQKSLKACVSISFAGDPASGDDDVVMLGEEHLTLPQGSHTVTLTARALKRDWQKLIRRGTQISVGADVQFKTACSSSIGPYVAAPAGLSISCVDRNGISPAAGEPRQVSGRRFIVPCKLSRE